MNENKLRELNQQRLKQLKEKPLKITTYDEVEKFIKELVKQTKDKNYTGVYGIPRGGLIFAFLYSYYMNIPLLGAPCKNCLVIDDDIGTGLTIQGYIGKYDTAVMFSNKLCSIKPTYLYEYYKDDEYRVFPWNIKEES